MNHNLAQRMRGSRIGKLLSICMILFILWGNFYLILRVVGSDIPLWFNLGFQGTIGVTFLVLAVFVIEQLLNYFRGPPDHENRAGNLKV